MKIGILTFHEIYNPGAFLQAYATSMTLKALGHDVRVINYTSPRHRFRPWRKLIRNPHVLVLHPQGWWESFRRHASFSAVQPHLRPTVRLHRHEDIEKVPFDAVVVGADIVWNYQSPLWGDDPVYFGHHLTCRKLISYAPSCGPLNLVASAPDFVTDGLRKFHAISVRDYKTAKMVQQAISKSVPVVMDPTFDLDVSRLPEGRTAPADRYLFVYAIPNLVSREAVKKIRDFAHTRELLVVAACYRQPWADRNIIDANPFDWVELIRQAACVFTNTFHGAIFSAKLNKLFALEFNSAIESKIKPVLENLSLENRQIKPSGDLKTILNCPYDRREVTRAIEVQAKNNRDFLRQALTN